MESINLLGVNIHSLTSNQLNVEIKKLIEVGDRHIVANVNINAMNIAYEEEWFRCFLNDAAINFCDGDGVRLGARMKGKNIMEKITYNRWIWEFAKFCEIHNFSFYLIGSEQDTIEKAAKVLKEKYPKLDIKGWRSGFFKDEKEINDSVLEINNAKPDIILMGMGMPHQEKWILNNSKNVDFKIALTGGAVFEYISGKNSMTPDIFFQLKLEWFYRFLMEPRRLFKRYFIGNPLFIIRTLLSK